MEIHLAYFSEVFKAMIKQIEAATDLFPSFVMCTMAYQKGTWFYPLNINLILRYGHYI